MQAGLFVYSFFYPLQFVHAFSYEFCYNTYAIPREVCAMIELRHVTKRYGAVEALHDVSFRAPEGQIVGLLGQNGAGKSTTLNILTGYLPPTSGRCWWTAWISSKTRASASG